LILNVFFLNKFYNKEKKHIILLFSPFKSIIKALTFTHFCFCFLPSHA